MKKALYILAFVIVGLFATNRFFIVSSNPILTFQQNTQIKIQYQVFYTPEPGHPFLEKQSCRQTVPADVKQVRIELPTQRIVRLRLDLGFMPNTLTLSDIKINGIELPIDKFTPHNIKSFRPVSKHQAEIYSTTSDPYLEYIDDLNLAQPYTFNFTVFIVLIFIFACLGHCTFKILSLNKNKIDLTFLVFFVILLFIPMSHISNADRALDENRMLATYQPLFNGYVLNEKYGPQFDAYFNDRFNGRTLLTKLYFELIEKRFKLGFSIGNDMVVIGQDNWLFIKEGNTLDHFQNKVLFTEEQLEHIAKYLQDINNWAKKHNKSFYYLICPDKHRIYGEYITFVKKVRPDSESRIQQLIEYLHKHTDVKVIYPYDTLRANKNRGLLYYKHDTHWNPYGAYIGYLELMKAIRQDHPQMTAFIPSNFTVGREKAQDLEAHIHFSVPADKTKYKIPKVTELCPGVPDTLFDNSCTNPNGKLRLMMYRDSFTTFLKLFLDRTFSQARYVWHYNVTSEDLQYIEKEADIIVLEHVERFVDLVAAQQFPEE